MKDAAELRSQVTVSFRLTGIDGTKSLVRQRVFRLVFTVIHHPDGVAFTTGKLHLVTTGRNLVVDRDPPAFIR